MNKMLLQMLFTISRVDFMYTVFLSTYVRIYLYLFFNFIISEFFLRVVKSIFSAHELGTWQYFTDLPYESVTIDTLWRVFYILHLNYHNDVCQSFGEGVESECIQRYYFPRKFLFYKVVYFVTG